MKRFLVLAAIAAALTGCATQAEIRASHAKACTQEGFRTGTAVHNRCVEMKQRQWRAAMQRENMHSQQRMMRNMQQQNMRMMMR